MESFKYMEGRMLTWSQPSCLKPEFELRFGDRIVATLSWKKAFGTLAEATIDKHRFTFKRSGFWKPYVTVRKDGATSDSARVELQWLHNSTLVTGEGKIYEWSLLSMWRQEWGFTASERTPIVKFKSRLAATGVEADVEVVQGQETHPDIPLLVTLGWYLLAAHEMSDASGAELAVLSAVM